MLRFALQNLCSRPLRTTLSVLGLTVAVAGMVGLFSIAGGIDRLVRSTFELIPGMIVQQQGAPMPIFSALPADWQGEIAALPGVHAVNAEVLARVNQINGEGILSPPRFLLGVDIDSRLKLRHGVYDEHLLPGGRFLNNSDRGQPHCVISRQIAEQFQRQVGDTLEVNGVEFKIVGLYHCGSLILDVNILADLDVVREIARMDRETVSCFYVEPDGSVPDQELADRIEAHFVGRSPRLAPGGGWERLLSRMVTGLGFPSPHGPAGAPDSTSHPASAAAQPPTSATNPTPPRESPVEVRTQAGWTERFDEFTADLKLFLSVMTAVGLLIAVFSIVNTMLMSVTERMVEFGILRANGWSKGDVLRLITWESGWLGLAGGVAGVAVGWGAVQGINLWQPDRLHLYAGPELLAFSIGVSLVLGVLGGLYPAWRAASKSPMEAIRRV